MSDNENQNVDVRFSIMDENKNQLEKHRWNLKWFDAVFALTVLEQYSREQITETTHSYECFSYNKDGNPLYQFWYQDDEIASDTWVIVPGAAQFRQDIIEYSNIFEQQQTEMLKSRRCKEMRLRWDGVSDYLNKVNVKAA
jgi:hypothetical protein